tara:strand:- start:782 stop:1333 length:552 start_codon:yes stop_codon:yes gene_type:complete
MVRDSVYEKNNIGYDVQYPREEGGGIKCKNYEICEAVLPSWWYECKGHYICMTCDTMFGTWSNSEYGIFKTEKGVLPIIDDTECPICLERKRSVTQPNCEHTLCIECFKRCYYGDWSGAPEFPYSKEVEDLYHMDDENYDHIKWKKDYPLIETWGLEYDRWYDDIENKQANEEYLRCCSLCRK